MKDGIKSTLCISVQKHVIDQNNVDVRRDIHENKLLVILESFERVNYYKVLHMFHFKESKLLQGATYVSPQGIKA